MDGYGCPKCSKTLPHTEESFLNKLKECNPNFDNIEILEEYKNLKTKLLCFCKVHKSKFYITPSSLLNGFGCPDCHVNPIRKKYQTIYKAFEDRGYLLLQDEYKDNKQKLKYICKKHPEIEQYISYNSLANGSGCRFCKSSKGENKILDYLIINKIIFKPQISFDDCRNVLPLPFDFAVLDKYGKIKFLIEYQGQQHEFPLEMFGGEKAFAQRLFHDNIKREYCQNNNIKLVEIWYYDFKNIKNILDNELKVVNMIE